jgi:putative PEP-CTERM system TPR-repeat lipoprotein
VLGLVAVDRFEGKIDDGIKRLEDYIKAQSHAATARLALADTLNMTANAGERIKTVLAEGVRQEPTDPALRLALIDQLLRMNDAKAANQAAQEAASALPQNPDMLERLARTQLLLGDKGQALKSYNQLIAVAPTRAYGYLGLAQLQVANQDYAAAEREVKRALEAEPSSQLAQRFGIQLAVRQGRTDEALAALHARQKAQPQEAYAYVAEADIEFSRKKMDAGIALLRKAIVLNEPGDAPARLFAALLAAGKPDEAKAFEIQWIASHNNDRGFRAATADILLSRGDLEAALSRYEAMLKLSPDTLTLINNVAWLRSRTGKAGAIELAERGLKLEPDNQALRDTYATVLSDAKKFDKALTLQRQLVGDYPDNPNYKLTLAQILIASGDKAGAKQQLDELAKLGPKFPQYRTVAALLKSV